MGHATAFRIDPWSRCAAAFHVFEDLFETNRADSRIRLKRDIRLAALEFPGFGYGTVRMPDGAWTPVAESYGIVRIEEA